MSIDTCKNCGGFIDTDNEPEAYYLTTEDGEEIALDYALCSVCREDKDVEARLIRTYPEQIAAQVEKAKGAAHPEILSINNSEGEGE